MAPRILSAEISHETNTFSVLTTSIADYERRQCYRGAEVRARMGGTRTEMAAHIDYAAQHGWDLVQPIAAHATPSGPTTPEAWAELSGLMIEAAKTGVDGIVLALHGAMVTVDQEDAEGDLLERLRAVVGLGVPIAVTLDLHANVTDRMAALADALVPFRTYPHIDQYEVATAACEIVRRALAGEIRPKTVIARRPTLEGCNHGRTQDGPMVDLLARAEAIQASDAGVLAIGICAGFQWSDIPEAGPSVTVTGDGLDPRFRIMAEELMDEVWERRTENTVPLLSLNEAMEKAKAVTGGGPLVIGDTTDNPGGGGYGDGVRLLEAMIDAGLGNAGFAAVCDPDAAEACHAAGVGGSVSLPLGAKVDPATYGPPLEVRASVTALSDDGAFVCDGPMWAGIEVRLGRSAAIEIDTRDGGRIAVILSSNNLQVTDQQAFRRFGIDPAALSVVAVKSSHHFRAAFQPIASEVVTADSGGLCSQDIASFDFKRLRRPIWPLDAV